MITTQSEQKIMELRSNIENLRTYNEKLAQDIQEAKQKEIEVRKLYILVILIFKIDFNYEE
jgi:hypothetical protein